MATIRAVCTDCGDEVDLQPTEITLVVADQHDEAPRAGSYGFNCPECERYVVKPADERAIGLLMAGGVQPSRIGGGAVTTYAGARPSKPAHPEDPPAGPALTLDDLIDLHFKLEERGWFDELLALTIPGR